MDENVPLCSKLSQPRDRSPFPRTMSAHTGVAQELLCEVAIASSVERVSDHEKMGQLSRKRTFKTASKHPSPVATSL
jgi:hypothetical protein